MDSHAGNRRFRPSLFAVVLTLIGVAGGIRLGVWQLGRAEEKSGLIAQFARGADVTVEFADNAASLPRYQHVHLSGRYDSQHQILLDNMPAQDGRPGYRVLTPMKLDNGEWLLVDRGWVPLGATRSDLPQVQVAETSRDIFGRVDDLPRPGVRLTEQTDAHESSWPRVMNFPKHEQLEHALQRPLKMRIVRLDAAEPEGFERQFSPSFGFGPERHLAYAAQWFAMAGAIAAIFIIISFKQSDSHDGTG